MSAWEWKGTMFWRRVDETYLYTSLNWDALLSQITNVLFVSVFQPKIYEYIYIHIWNLHENIVFFNFLHINFKFIYMQSILFNYFYTSIYNIYTYMNIWSNYSFINQFIRSKAECCDFRSMNSTDSFKIWTNHYYIIYLYYIYTDICITALFFTPYFMCLLYQGQKWTHLQ